MNATNRVVCCAALVLTGVMLPVRANAADAADKKFLTMAAQSDQNEMALSKLAEQKASSPDVKAFADKMVTDHTELTNNMKPFADQWGLTPPTGPDSEHQKELDKLSGLSGSDFDKAYMSDMVKDHTKALNAFTKEANDTKDTTFQATVMKGKTVVSEHKDMAVDLKKKV